MELSIIVSSLAISDLILNGKIGLKAVALGAGFFTGIQMSVLGALLTLTGEPWFHAHESTSWLWDLTPLEDQQLGGAAMWVAGGLLFVGYALYAVADIAFREDRDERLLALQDGKYFQ